MANQITYGDSSRQAILRDAQEGQPGMRIAPTLAGQRVVVLGVRQFPRNR